MAFLGDREVAAGGWTRARFLLVAGALTCAVAGILFLPREVDGADPTRPGLRAVLVDASGSAVRGRGGWAREVARKVRREAKEAMEMGEEIFVLLYGRAPRPHFGPGAPDELLTQLSGTSEEVMTFDLGSEGQGGSDLAGALDLASQEMGEPGRAPGRLVVIGDGTSTGSDPLPRVERLVDLGAGVHWSDLDGAVIPDLALESVVAPDRVPGGSALACRVGLAWDSRSTATSRPALELVLRDRVDGEERARTRRVLDPPVGLLPDSDGRQRWEVRVDLGIPADGSYVLEARARIDGGDGEFRGDPIPENDSLARDVQVGGRLQVGMVLGERVESGLRERLAAADLSGIDLVPLEVRELAARLEILDLLWTLDVSPASLSGPVLHEFISTGGGGWLASGGWGLLPGWRASTGPGDSAATALLPLHPAEDTEEDREVILLIDGSGSMAGEPFERVKKALFELVPAALPSDELSVRFFTEVLGPAEFRSTGRTPEERLAEMAPLLQAKVPTGGTDIVYSILELAEGRTASSLPGMVLLLSDGRTNESGRSASEARTALSGAGLDLRVLSMGERPDEEFLSGLLLPGESIVRAGDLSDLGSLLSREVNRRRFRRQPGLAVVPGDPASLRSTLGMEVVTAQLRAGASETWGPLAGYLRSDAAEAADVLWRSNVESEPLLAAWSVGRGQVAALALTPDGEWAPGLGRDLSWVQPLLLALGAGRTLDVDPIQVRWVGERLVLDDVPTDWPLELEGRLRPAEVPPGLGVGTEIELVPERGSLVLDPRSRRVTRGASWSGGLSRGEALALEILGPQGEVLAEVATRAPGPVEWCSGGADTRHLGSPLDRPVGEPSSVVRERRPHPLARWVLRGGILLLGLGSLLLLMGFWAPERASRSA